MQEMMLMWLIMDDESVPQGSFVKGKIASWKSASGDKASRNARLWYPAYLSGEEHQDDYAKHFIIESTSKDFWENREIQRFVARWTDNNGIKISDKNHCQDFIKTCKKEGFNVISEEVTEPLSFSYFEGKRSKD